MFFKKVNVKIVLLVLIEVFTIGCSINREKWGYDGYQ